MSADSEPPKDNPPAKTGPASAKESGDTQADREARLGDALRANLRRRKAAAKTRKKD